jgi:predicted small secreted protein
VCIAGSISRKSLADTYGLSDAQIKEFFKKPTTVRMNISGSAQYVESASLYFGLRLIGD